MQYIFKTRFSLSKFVIALFFMLVTFMIFVNPLAALAVTPTASEFFADTMTLTTLGIATTVMIAFGFLQYTLMNSKQSQDVTGTNLLETPVADDTVIMKTTDNIKVNLHSLWTTLKESVMQSITYFRRPSLLETSSFSR